MSSPNFIILYVNSIEKSVAFYAQLLERKPLEQSPMFAMFALDGGMMLGLWAKQGVQPPAALCGGGAELCFSQSSHQAVDALYATWRSHGLSIIQEPAQLEFGYTFTALDPDEHRLRVLMPS